ncbi:alpha/beta fold hydrolase [Paenibacillus sp. YN15]|uniref:alpha/beta fold hydrolase n=1 Tax=Paenibacillus sp. YN15 TaxID=1742774 RepID=UPI000DCB37D1|nr:alpha/beta hydrolase [Paenibacillus sp. YN15]RAV00609.1 alpha/beta hydrolase [Paenibacillus sp. YN15]
MPMAFVNGTRLHYHVEGRGIPLIFIHPPLLNQEIFNYQKAQLSDAFKIITFDIRGHGLSDASPAAVTYPLVVEDMRQLLEHLDVREAVVCGYSTGGGIALEAMLAHPQTFTGGILISAMSEASDWYLKGRIRAASGLSRIKAKRLLGGLVGWGNADMSLTFNNLYKGAVQGDSRNIRQYYDYSLTYSCTDQLSSIEQPVLLLYGEEDAAFHRYARMLEARLPYRDLVFIEKASHQLPTKAPRTMNRIVEQWVSRRFGGAAGRPGRAAEEVGTVQVPVSAGDIPPQRTENTQQL